jgi:hypothetical protein
VDCGPLDARDALDALWRCLSSLHVAPAPSSTTLAWSASPPPCCPHCHPPGRRSAKAAPIPNHPPRLQTGQHGRARTACRPSIPLVLGRHPCACLAAVVGPHGHLAREGAGVLSLQPRRLRRPVGLPEASRPVVHGARRARPLVGRAAAVGRSFQGANGAIRSAVSALHTGGARLDSQQRRKSWRLALHTTTRRRPPAQEILGPP